MIEISLIFSTFSGVFLLWGYLVYNKDIFLGTSCPNVTSWGLWSATTILNMASYFAMTNDALKISLPVVETFACLFTFAYALSKKRKSARMSMTDKMTLSIGMTSILAWWFFRSPMFANMVMQFAVIAGFVSTYRSIWTDPNNEKTFPWTIFSFAYVFLLITVLLRWSGTLSEMVSPLLGVILHSGLVFLIMYRTNFLKKAQTTTSYEN